MRTELLSLRHMKRYKVNILEVGFEIVLLVALWRTAVSFHPLHQKKPTNIILLSPTPESRYRPIGFHFRAFFSSGTGENSRSDGSESPLEAMRRLLEFSWDADKMGRVPVDAREGANEVYSALLEAFSVAGNESGIYMVELLLPAYDITQGERMYDEVSSRINRSIYFF
jgi:hypothetical protein